jgi:formate dehydrogenase (NADP+) beta subunit
MPDTSVSQEWLSTNFPCQSACPVGTEAGRYVALIAEGKYRDAYAVARRPNPLASICGRVCAAPCESACRRGELDAPVAIRSLKRFVTERFGVESMIDFDTLGEIYGHRAVRYPDDPIAVIGAGPAGLAAAHDLALSGYPVTIFEAQPVAGGMLRLGIPEYRLPRELIKHEVNAILSLGVEIEHGQRLGEDFTLEDLKARGFKSVFIGIGCQRSRDLQLPGVEHDGVLKGVEFLLNMNLGYKTELGRKVVVIGGGNVAIDVARAAVRSPGAEEDVNPEINIVTALDIARSAVRFGAKEIHMVCLESREEMPADLEEIEAALEEGITIHYGRGPTRILGDGKNATGLETIQCSSVFDGDGRFRPTFEEGTEIALAADTIIMAVGQQSDLSWIRDEDGLEVTNRGTLQIDAETLATTSPGVYAGGDVAFGPRIAIQAIADGKRAAAAIHAKLRGQTAAATRPEIVVRQLRNFRREPDYEAIPRQRPETLSLNRRVGIAEIEQCLEESAACREASRCLQCWINTEFHQDKMVGSECLLCGGCADVCPENCIELISTRDIEADPNLKEDLVAEFGTDAEVLFDRDRPGTAILKDETICIRCGLCALRCPAGTITMQGYEIQEVAIG